MTRIYDVLDPQFHDDPFPVYAALRDEFPVYHDEERGFWALSRFADVFAAATDVETYSSYAVEAEALLPQLNFLDGARHRDLRALVSRGFTPRRVAADRAVGREGRRRSPRRHGRYADRATWSPISVHRSRVGSSDRSSGSPTNGSRSSGAWTEELTSLGQTGEIERLQEIATAIYGLFGDLLAARRAEPTDDLMSALVERRDRRPSAERRRDPRVLLPAREWWQRHDDAPDRHRLRATGGESRRAKSVWYANQLACRMPSRRCCASSLPRSSTHAPSPATSSSTACPSRPTVASCSCGVRPIATNASSCNPDRFDIDRPNTRHLGFGVGPHFCLGASLARLEARAAFAALLERWPEFELVEPPTRLVSPWARGFVTVPIQW